MPARKGSASLLEINKTLVQLGYCGGIAEAISSDIQLSCAACKGCFSTATAASLSSIACPKGPEWYHFFSHAYDDDSNSIPQKEWGCCGRRDPQHKGCKKKASSNISSSNSHHFFIFFFVDIRMHAIIYCWKAVF